MSFGLKIHRYRMVAIVSRAHKFLYRILNGRFVAHLGKADFLLLTTIGRRTNQKKDVVLLYVRYHGHPAVIASFGGNPKAPNWLLNVRNNLSVEFQVGPIHRIGTARIASTVEREELWPKFIEIYPGYKRYQSRTTRKFPIVILTHNDP